MKILNNTIINTPISHLCEFPEHFVISGSLYTKSPLSPLPVKFASIEDPNSSVLFNKTHDITTMDDARHRDHENTYVSDEHEEGVVWLFYDRNNVFKAIPNEFGYEIKKPTVRNNGGETPVEVLASNPSEFYKYAFQDEECIYYWIYTSTDQANWFVSLNKKTLEITDYFTATTGAGVGYVEPMGYYYDALNDVCYHYYFYYNYTPTSSSSHYWYIYSFNMSTKTKTSIKSQKLNYASTSGVKYSRIIPSFVKNNYTDGMMLTHYHGNTSGSSYVYYQLYGYQITDTATMNLKSVYTVNTNSSYLYVTSEKIKLFLFHPQPNIVCEFVKNQGFNVRTLNKDIDFKNPTSVSASVSSSKNQTTAIKDIHGTNVYSCGSISNDKTIFFVSNTKISIWQWNESTLQYDLTNELEDHIEKVGVDFNENIWVRNTDGELYTVPTNYTDYEITVSTDQKDFDYIGENILSNIKVKALNRNGVHVSCRVRLKITGSALFAQNQSKELELELPGRELEIPITIYDTGIIHIAVLS